MFKIKQGFLRINKYLWKLLYTQLTFPKELETLMSIINGHIYCLKNFSNKAILKKNKICRSRCFAIETTQMWHLANLDS